MKYFIQKYIEEHKTDFLKNPNAPRALTKIREACENCKIALSNERISSYPICLDPIEGISSFKLKVQRKEIEKICDVLFKMCLEPIEKALKNANKTSHQINGIALIGGSSCIVKVRQLVSDFFPGKQLFSRVNPLTAVAKGAAIVSSMYQKSQDQLIEGFVIKEIVSHSIGIRTEDGIMRRIISKGETLPITKTERFIIPQSMVKATNLFFCEGERPLTKHCHLVSQFDLNGIPPAEGYTYSIEVTLTLDTSLMLSAEAILIGNSTGEIKNNLAVKKLNFGYSGNELQKLNQRAEDFAEEDEKEVVRLKMLFNLKNWCQNLKVFFMVQQKDHLDLFNQNFSKKERFNLIQCLERLQKIAQTGGIPSEDEINKTKNQIREKIDKYLGSFPERKRPPWLNN